MTVPDARPRRSARNGAPPVDADWRDWAIGIEALGRIPARKRLEALADLERVKIDTEAELETHEHRLDRLRYEPETMLASDVGERLGAMIVAAMAPAPPAPLLIDRLDPVGHTILYGTGGAGKGLLTARWLVRLLADHRVLLADYENHPDEWARRCHGFGGGDVLDRLIHVAPLTARWGGRRGAIWRQAPELRELAQAFGATYLVVDSIVPACAGTDPLKPEAAAQYAGALEFIGLPALSLAQVRKDESLAYPFGSAFWHNLARMTWSLKRVGEQTLLANVKHNNYPKAPAQLVEVAWLDGVPGDLWERPAAAVLASQIDAALGDGALTLAQLVDALNEELAEDDEPVKADSVSKALRRGERAKPARFRRAGDRWERCP